MLNPKEHKIFEGLFEHENGLRPSRLVEKIIHIDSTVVRTYDGSMIENLLKKNIKKRKGWIKQVGIEAYRLYDWQIPEYPFYIDVYGKYIVVYDRTEKRDESRKEQMIADVNSALINLFECDKSNIVWKLREKQKGKEQYEKLGSDDHRIVVKEGPRKYWVNLFDYLDTGLFLDHRPLRSEFQKNNQGRFLNLFSYTCSVGVAAAMGGAITTNVDISKTYLNWGKDNFRVNNVRFDQHHFIHADVIEWLTSTENKYDVIFLDPPSFSNSKRMKSDSFDVLRDQELLVEACLKLLNPGGKLYFSNNHSKFRLSQSLQKYDPKNITSDTIPFDFHNQKVHWCFKFEV